MWGLIYAQPVGQGYINPLTLLYSVYFKEKLQEYKKYHKALDQGTKRYFFLKDMIFIKQMKVMKVKILIINIKNKNNFYEIVMYHRFR